MWQVVIHIVDEVVSDMTHNRSFNDCGINVSPTQSVILNVVIHSMAHNDFYYINVLILNILHFWHIPYTLILDDLHNFPIATIFWVI